MDKYKRILDYRKAIDERCFFCSEKVEVLHHKDENQSNNSGKNLLSLCTLHHELLKHDSDMQKDAGIIPQSSLTWARNMMAPDRSRVIDIDDEEKLPKEQRKLLKEHWTGANIFEKGNIRITVDGSDRVCRLIESFGFKRIS